MQIRKFEAEDMPQALRAIREEMGPDAVVLSTREVRKKGGVLGILSRPTLEVMVAVDAPGLSIPPAPPQRPAVTSEGGHRTERQLDFDSLLREMEGRVERRPPPIGPSRVAIPPDGQIYEALWEELRTIRESVGALRAKVMSLAPPAEPVDGQIYEELRGIRESVGVLRAKVMSFAPPSEPADGQIYEELRAIREGMGALRARMISLTPPSDPTDPMDGQVYEALRGMREAMGALRAKVMSLAPPSESLELPIYEALCSVKESVDALRARAVNLAEFPKKFDLAPDARVYEELRAIQSAIFALPARGIVHVDASPVEGDSTEGDSTERGSIERGSGASGTENFSGAVSGVVDALVYDELRAIRESVLALQARTGGDESRTAGSLQALKESVAALMARPQEGIARSELLPLHQELRAVKEFLREMKAIEDARRDIRPVPRDISGEMAAMRETLHGIKDAVNALTTVPPTEVHPPPSLEHISQIVMGPNQKFHDALIEIKASLSALTLARAATLDLPSHSPVYERLQAIESSMERLWASVQTGNARQAAGIHRAQNEMQNIRESVGVQQYRTELSTLRPILIGLFDKLIANGLAPHIAVALFKSAREKLSSDALWKDDAVQEALRQAIQEAVYVSGPIRVEEGTTKIVLCVGPSGVGRKMTLAKLVARETARKVTVVSLGSAAEAAQLAEYLKQTPIAVMASEGALQEAVALRSEGEVIFVDVSPPEEGSQEGLNADGITALKALSGLSVETHLVLPAPAPESGFVKWIEALPWPADFLLFTKLDEASLYGPLFNFMKREGKPLSYFSTGVRMPEDLEVATPGRMAELLLRQALHVDLAEGLQTKTLGQDSEMGGDRTLRVVSVTSGKGGVGKTNVVANLAMAFSKLGKRVLVLDADLGLGNLDVLFGVVPKYTLEHVLAGQKRIEEVLVSGPGNIRILPTSSGAGPLNDLSSEQKVRLLSELDQLDGVADIFLIDTGAGIGSTVLYFNTAAQEIILVVTPEPTSLADAYALMKVMSKQHGEKRFNLIVNMVKSESEAQAVVQKLSLVCEQFLEVALEYVGSVPFDDYLRMAVCTQKSVVDAYPHARSSTHFMQIGKRLLQKTIRNDSKGSVQFLWRRLLSKTAVG
jgi:flagellar biosynthesis protein FlhG